MIAFMSLGAPEIIVIMLILLLLFGPKKIPELARSLRVAKHEFSKTADEITETIKNDKPSKDK